MSSTIRFDELDAARGVAILMMILFHILFDLFFFGILPVSVMSGFWRYFAFTTASLFLIIAGISLSIRYERARQEVPYLSGTAFWSGILKHGVVILACGGMVTLATYLYLGQGYVVFGILHLIGISILLSPLFLRFGRANIAIGALVIATGILLSMAAIGGPWWLIPLGIHPATFWSVDYEPLLPWFGIVLAGIGIGNIIYPAGRRRTVLPESLMRSIAPLGVLGRRSLVIYLVHQPVILLVLQAITGQPLLL